METNSNSTLIIEAKQKFIFNRLDASMREKVLNAPDPMERVSFEGSEYTLYDLRGLINENQREHGDNQICFGPGFNDNYENYPPLKTIEAPDEENESRHTKETVSKLSSLLDPTASERFADGLESTYDDAEKNTKVTAVELFRRSIMNQTKDYPPPAPLMYLVQNGERFPHRTKKSFSLQQGKQKSKKTTELAIEVAAYINTVTSTDNIYFECVEPGVVLFFDCEQGESYAARTMKLILKLAGLDYSDRLVYCDLRELAPKERIAAMEAGITDIPNVKWVVIDGLVDAMEDFMSAEEAHMLITLLLRLCSKYDIHITGVLHQNKGLSKDARAHVGSIAGQKCEVEIMVERNSDDPTISVVSAKESRGLPFEDFAIRWEKGGLPYIMQDWVHISTTSSGAQISKTPYDTEHEIHLRLVKSCFNNNPEKMTRSQLLPSIQACISQHQDLKKPIGRDKAALWIAYWVESGYLDQEGTHGTKSSKYFIKYNDQK